MGPIRSHKTCLNSLYKGKRLPFTSLGPTPASFSLNELSSSHQAKLVCFSCVFLSEQ